MENKHSVENWNRYYAKERKTDIRPKANAYDIFLCDSIFERYLPFNRGHKEDVKICEVGSGDGRLLKKIADKFNYQPFGIEYSTEPIQEAKQRGITVIHGDTFDQAILKEYEEHFDIVFSYGFIEHIIPPEKAIQAHLKILKKGGILVLQIPRFKKFNWLKAKIFRPDLLPLHNLAIMEQEVLSELGKKEGIQEIFCRNYGTFKLRIPMAQKNIRWYILKAICSLEYILNPMCRFFFKDKGFETRLLSSAVMFIGRKV